MARYYSGTEVVEAVQVAHADINNNLEIDGAPFTEVPTPQVILDAVMRGTIVLHHEPESDYVHLLVHEQGGVTRKAGPTDRVLCRDDGVCTAICDWVFRATHVPESQMGPV